MFSYIVDKDIRLQLLAEGHADELFRLIERNRTHLREWLPWVDATVHPEDTRRFIESTRASFFDRHGLHAGIFYRGVLVGCIGLNQLDWLNRKTSVGYWLGAEYQGQGIMTRSCRGLLNYVFSELGFNRVEIRAAVENRKSRAIPERLGFTQEGILREAEWLYDHYVDHVVYGMLKREWKNPKDGWEG